MSMTTTAAGAGTKRVGGAGGATPGDSRVSLGLAALRVAAGAVFVAHGGQKLFVYGLGGVSESFGGMGIPLAEVAAPTVALIEALGGLALILGLFTRFAAAGLALVMLGALLLVHLPNGFFLPGGIEFVLVLLGSAVALGLSGAGAYSLDAVVRRRRAAH